MKNKRNNAFICLGCGENISPAKQTSRNHCPQCFLSLHVDGEVPGDRNTTCGGKMYPTHYIIANGKIKIHFLCRTCGKIHINKAASDDAIDQLDAWIKKRKKQSISS